MSFGASGDAADDRALLRHELFSSLTAVSANLQLLRRRVLRADGLSSLERELLLGTIASSMVGVVQLTTQLEAVLPPDAKGLTDADPSP